MQKSADENVVVVVIYQKEFSAYEEIALRQCLNIFDKRVIFIVKPESLDLTDINFIPDTVIQKSFPDRFFLNTGTYSRMLLSDFFYKEFSQYRYMMIYQTDAFVFKDEMDKWCNTEFDYIGAPWFKEFDSREGVGEFIGVGNGGFSLRNIAAHLKVLHSYTYITPVKENWRNRFVKKQYGNNLFAQAGGFILDHTIRNNTHWRLNSYRGHEDQFWGLDVPRRFKDFKLPSYEAAAAFAFEMQPRRLYELNHRQLPFGCHAWWKYDLDFWKPHIEKFGYQL